MILPKRLSSRSRDTAPFSFSFLASFGSVKFSRATVIQLQTTFTSGSVLPVLPGKTKEKKNENDIGVALKTLLTVNLVVTGFL